MMTKSTTMLERSRELEKEIIQWRRHIHAHPELSFQEHETAKLACEKLKSLGYSVKTAVGKTGVVADIGSGDQAAGAAVRGGRLIHIDDRSVLMEAEQFPRTTVVIAAPPAVQDVAEAEVAVAEEAPAVEPEGGEPVAEEAAAEAEQA